jgi:hypothetical protein
VVVAPPPAQLLAWALRFAGLVLPLDAFDVGAPLAVAPVLVCLQLLAASVPLTPGRRRDGEGPDRAALAGTKLVDLLLGLAALAICGIPPRVRALRPATAIA